MTTNEEIGEWTKYGMTKAEWDKVHDEALRASVKANTLIDHLPENFYEYMAEITEPYPSQPDDPTRQREYEDHVRPRDSPKKTKK